MTYFHYCALNQILISPPPKKKKNTYIYLYNQPDLFKLRENVSSISTVIENLPQLRTKFLK